MKAVLAKLFGILKRVLPTGLASKLWTRRLPISLAVILSTSAAWLICGAYFEEPKAVMIGWLLVCPIGLWLGYRAGTRLQDRRAAAAPPAPPAPASAKSN